MDLKNREQVRKFKLKLRRLKLKKKAIESKFPHIDFMDGNVRQAFRDWEETTTKLVYTSVDLKFCFMADKDKMCSICSCDKYKLLSGYNKNLPF